MFPSIVIKGLFSLLICAKVFIVTSNIVTSNGLPVPLVMAPAERTPVEQFHDEEGERNNRRKSIFKSTWFWLSLFVLVVVGMMVYLVFHGLSAKEANPISITDPPPSPAAPSAAPTMDPLLALLPSSTQFAIAQQPSEETPQYLAHFWLREDPHFWDYSKERLLQRFGLAVLYLATLGDHWTHNEQWLEYEAHECDWWTNSKSSSSICDGEQMITALDLQGNELKGSVPEELGLLTSLQRVSLRDNPQLQGTVPNNVCGVETLTFDCSRTLCGCTQCDCDIRNLRKH